MLLLKSILKKRLWPVLITTILVIYQLVRIIAFVNVYGGLEHDGGWALSLARQLAEQGTYTTTVSTIVNPAVTGGVNIDQKFDIQAPDGRIWFRTSNNIGPASIVLNALVLKLFGAHFWALRIGPLLFYTLFLLLAVYILYQLAGFGATVLFNLFLFFYPHLSIFLGYEALGEMLAMVLVLWAYLAFAAATQKKEHRWRHFWMAGLIAGLAMNTKLVTLWSVSGIFVWAIILWLIDRISAAGVKPNSHRPMVRQAFEGQHRPKLHWLNLVWLGIGAGLVLVLWELLQLVMVTRLTNFRLYLRHAQQRLDVILNEGSGIGERLYSGPEFFWDKFFLLTEVTHSQRWVAAMLFAAMFLGGLVLVWMWRNQSRKQHLLAALWLGWLANTAWFAGLAKTGWPRHFWFGLVLGVMLLCVITVTLARNGLQSAVEAVGREDKASSQHLRLQLVAAILLLALIGWGFASQPHVRGFFLPDEIIPYWREKRINFKYGATLPWIVIPRVAQSEAVNYITQMPPEANVFYPAQHKAAEISARTGRIVYPLERRQFMEAHAEDVALISPTIIAPWMDPVRREALLNLVQEECPQPLIANDYYMICPFLPE